MSATLQKIYKAALLADRGDLVGAALSIGETILTARAERDDYGLCEALFFQSDLYEQVGQIGDAIDCLEEVLHLEEFDFAAQIIKAQGRILELRSF
ncbi:hypothetical protein [Halocynthiibacter sp.]|uniref:hypothetical protein n=1 Tax=Halocynthiibacter sp. TaxID=1979210 RepID=UPI003C68BE67